ncbi:MAG: hypothetical protein JWO96_812 [Candidatus Saccharibacteria bacterium]|nr:hypothetical protein [Candidatus Saccharibacteria bacterium]
MLTVHSRAKNLTEFLPGAKEVILNGRELPEFGRVALIDFTIQERNRPAVASHSQLEKVASQRGLWNQVGITFRGVMASVLHGERLKDKELLSLPTEVKEPALLEVVDLLYSVDSFATEAHLAIVGLQRVYNADDSKCQSPDKIRNHYAAGQVLAHHLYSQEISKSTTADSPEGREARLIQLYGRVLSMDDEETMQTAQTANFSENWRRFFWREQLDGIIQHPVVAQTVHEIAAAEISSEPNRM